MTASQYGMEKPEPAASGTGRNWWENSKSTCSDYITIPRSEYDLFLHASVLLDSVSNILTDKRLSYDSDRINALQVIMGLPYEQEGE